MVFERWYPVEYIKHNPLMGFLLGMSYTLFAMVIALFTFPQDPALVTVGLVSLLLLPSLGKFSEIERFLESKDDDVRIQNAFTFNKDFYITYTAIFFGIFFTFAAFSIALPSLAASKLFQPQLAIIGHAFTFSSGQFLSILSNNAIVLLACFFISLIAGNGSIFLITWNASVWGTIFGTIARGATENLQGNVLIIFPLIIISVFPHVLLEISSYIVATISGTVISDSLILDGPKNPVFYRVLGYNLILLAIALVLLLVGGLVETYVLQNFKVYKMITMFAK